MNILHILHITKDKLRILQNNWKLKKIKPRNMLWKKIKKLFPKSKRSTTAYEWLHCIVLHTIRFLIWNLKISVLTVQGGHFFFNTTRDMQILSIPSRSAYVH